MTKSLPLIPQNNKIYPENNIRRVFFIQNSPQSFKVFWGLVVPLRGGGGLLEYDLGSGRAAETWKVDPFSYQILLKNETRFYTIAAKFTENFTLFSKIVKLSSKFWYQIDEIGPIFMPIFDNFENMTHVYTIFCTE